MNELFDKLVSICSNLKGMSDLDPTDNFSSIENMTKNILNDIFKDDGKECIDIICTYNTDKINFGIHVNPTITDTDLLSILVNTEDISAFSRYSLEIDLTICDKLESREIAAYIIEEIASVLSINTVNNIRAILDLLLMDMDETIDIKQSVNYSQLLIFGIKDTIKKVSSLIYKPEESIGLNKYTEILNIKEELCSCSSKVRSYVFNNNELTDTPNLGILNWVLSVYKDVQTNYRMMKSMLNDALLLAGSKLDKKEIEKTLVSLSRALSEVVSESALLLDSLYEAKGFSLFKSLKTNGLRSIEDDLYEFKIRLKNAETEEDAIYILRQINTRISILEDYIYNTNISESEMKRWQGVIDTYRILRTELSNKKIGYKKSYGVFVDYDKFDKIEN